MKAFLLAAGYGTRLRPLTENMPKCLVPINGVPLLGWWLKLLKKHGIDEVLVNLHYLPEQVQEYIAQYNERHTDFVKAVYENKLLGSAGTIKNNSDFIPTGEPFFICYADNLTNINLTRMSEIHNGNPGMLTMALFHCDKPQQCGIATIEPDGKVTDFVEKPENPKSNLANAGIYVADYEFLNILHNQKAENENAIDLGRDILPKIQGNMYGYFMSEYLLDIGTLDNYRRAQQEWNYDYYEDTI